MRRLLLILSLLISPIVHADEDSPPLASLVAVSTQYGAMDAAAFRSDGRVLATGGRDHTIRLWNIEQGDMVREIVGHSDWITDLVWHPDNQRLISASRDDSVRVFNTQTGALETVITGHNDDVTAIAITPEGSVIVSGDRDGQIHFFHLDTEQTIATVTHGGGAVWDLDLHPTGDIVASAGEDGTVWLWGVWDGGWVTRFNAHDEQVLRVQFAADGRQLLTSSLDGTLKLWSFAAVRENSAATPLLTLSGHLAPALGMMLTEEHIISASLDGTVRVWDANSGTQLALISGSGIPLTELSAHPAGSIIVTGADGTLNQWDTRAEAIAQMRAAQQPDEIVQVATALPRATTSPAAQTPAQMAAAPTRIPALQSQTQAPPLGGRVLNIPRAGISSSVTTFPIENQTWAIDPWEPLVGHFWGTSWVTQGGNVVLGGHSEYPDGTPGIFHNLYSVGLGDEIFLQDGNVQRRYIVTNIREVDYRDLSVVYPTSHNRITLVTCDIPSYVASQGIYYERLVIIADEVPKV